MARIALPSAFSSILPASILLLTNSVKQHSFTGQSCGTDFIIGHARSNEYKVFRRHVFSLCSGRRCTALSFCGSTLSCHEAPTSICRETILLAFLLVAFAVAAILGTRPFACGRIRLVCIDTDCGEPGIVPQSRSDHSNQMTLSGSGFCRRVATWVLHWITNLGLWRPGLSHGVPIVTKICINRN